jgi:hypothetical protein
VALLSFRTSQVLSLLRPFCKRLPYKITFTFLNDHLLTKMSLMNLKVPRPQKISFFPYGTLPCLVFLTDSLCSLFDQ